MDKELSLIGVGSSLKGKPLAFAEAYFVSGNATQAAKDAGYTEKSAKNQGSRLLKKDDVKAYLAQLRGLSSADTVLNHKFVLDKLKGIVEVCLKKGLGFNPGAANRALELIGKHLGTFEPDIADPNKSRPAFIGIRITTGPGASVEFIEGSTAAQTIENKGKTEEGPPENVNETQILSPPVT